MSDQTTLALTQDPRTFQVVGLPTLDRVKNERVGELAKKLGRSSTEILVFGQAAQTAISGSADGMLQHVRMRSTGYAGELLRQLEEQMQSLDPSMLREVRGLLKSLPLVGRLFGSLDQRIRTFLQRFDAVEGVLNGIKVRLEEERIAAFQGIQQMETLRNDADRYKDALQICIAAAALKLVEFQEEYRQKQSALQGSVDSGELGNLQGLWDLMELLHQRVYSLQMALSLAENTTHESRQVEKVLTFSANALQEAATLGLTAWKQKLTVAINLLRARNQLEAAQQFRLLTDQLVRGNTKMLADMTTKIGEMQQRAFVAADAIVQANDSLGKIIATARQKDVEAQRAREAMLALVQESQKRLAESLRGAQLEHVPTASSAPRQIGPVDLAAGLVK